MNTFFKKHKNRNWTWKSPYGETKNEIDFIMCEQPGINQDKEVVGKIKCSDHRLVRANIVLNINKTGVNYLLEKNAI